MNRAEERVAQRYARAFLNVFGSELSVQEIANIKEAAIYFLQHQHACFLMDLSLLPQKEKEKAIDTICKRFALPAFCKKLCMLLIEHQRAFLLVGVFAYIVEEYFKDTSTHFFVVSTTTDLNDSEKQTVESFLERHIEGSVSCEYKRDKTLIAGMRIYSHNLLWDNSVKGRLRAVKETLRF